ncbi:RDD family protein [Dyella japonica]|uniref:RDD family protein n=1 Tax=Dyella japonica TaxID=231455 RepID=UPI0033998128
MEDTNTRNPYEAPSAPSMPPGFRASDVDFVKAERGTRFLAVLLDGLVYVGVMIPFFIIVAVTGGLKRSAGSGGMFAAIMALGGLAFLCLFIYNLVLLNREGQTLGKRWMKVRIVRSNGERAGLGRIFWLRMFVPGLIGRIPFVGVIFVLADPLFIFGEERRCVHDLLADTVVVNA